MLRRSKTDGGDSIPAEGANILAVVDDDDGRELLVQALRHWGFSAVGSTGLNDALVTISAADPPVDLVVADFTAGTTPALQLLDGIRASETEAVAGTRVVICTPVDENRLFSWQSGVDGFLARPFHADELRGAIVGALSRNSAERLAHREAQMDAGQRSA